MKKNGEDGRVPARKNAHDAVSLGILNGREVARACGDERRRSHPEPAWKTLPHVQCAPNDDPYFLTRMRQRDLLEKSLNPSLPVLERLDLWRQAMEVVYPSNGALVDGDDGICRQVKAPFPPDLRGDICQRINVRAKSTEKARDGKARKKDKRDAEVLTAALDILKKIREKISWTELASRVGQWLKDPPPDCEAWTSGTSRSSICERLDRVKDRLPMKKIGPWKKASGD